MKINKYVFYLQSKQFANEIDTFKNKIYVSYIVLIYKMLLKYQISFAKKMIYSIFYIYIY